MTKLDQRAGNMEISSFIFQDKSAVQRNCIVSLQKENTEQSL